MENSDKFLINITNTLARLSKVRLVKGFEIGSEFKKFSPWPLWYDKKNSDILEYLDSKGITTNKIPFFKAYEVSHSRYQELEHLEVNRDNLVFLRSYLEHRRIDPSRHGLKDMSISIAYDENNGDIDLFPSSTNDKRAIQAISERRDVLYLFNSNVSGWKAKIRSDLGGFVFDDLNWYPDHDFKLVSRLKSKSKRIHKGDIANRFVTSDLTNFERVIDQTKKNIEDINIFEPWSNRLRDITAISEANRRKQKRMKRLSS